jgi:hypothetical protein
VVAGREKSVLRLGSGAAIKYASLRPRKVPSDQVAW